MDLFSRAMWRVSTRRIGPNNNILSVRRGLPAGLWSDSENDSRIVKLQDTIMARDNGSDEIRHEVEINFRRTETYASGITCRSPVHFL